MSIISNKTIRASDNGKTNDYLENSYAAKFILDEVRNLICELNLETLYNFDSDKLAWLYDSIRNVVNGVFKRQLWV